MASLYEKEMQKGKVVTETSDKAWEWFKSSLWDILIVLTVIVYIATGLIEIQETGRTVWEILATAGMAFIFGYTVALLFNKKGLIKGMMHPLVVETSEEHDHKYREVMPYISKADEWCDQENTAALKIVRERILAKAALSYIDFFDEEGRFKNVDMEIPAKASKYQKTRALQKRKTIENAINAKITYLTISDLISSGANALDPNYLGRSKEAYNKATIVNNMLGRLIPAAIVGFFSVGMLEDASIGQFIWTSLQALIFIIMGYLKYLNAFYFVVDEDRMNNKKRIAYLNKFLEWNKEVKENGNSINSRSISSAERTIIQPTTTSVNPSDTTVGDDAKITTTTELIGS